jgi:hypothetical protein
MTLKSAAGNPQPPDIRDRLRRDHELALAELDALRREGEEHRRNARLRDTRRAWMIHTLAKEIVVYRALEGVESAGKPGSDAGRRFVEHELIEGVFDRLARAKSAASEWNARLEVARVLVLRRVEAERVVLFATLARRFDAQALEEMARQFESACAKLTVLEEAKAA